MDASQIRSRISELQDRVNTNRQNNKVGRHIDAIRSNLEKQDTDSVDPVAEKRRRTRTNHEVGSASNPVEPPEKEQNNVRIEKQHIEKLDQELTSILNDLKDLSDDVRELDPDELSDSLRALNEGLFGLHDDLSFTLLGRGNQPHFREHAEMINSKTADFDEDVENLREALDKIEDEFKYARAHLGDLSVPSRESVQEEVQEARAERAKQEFEEMKPYMDMRRLREEFEVGEVFTAQDLADRVDVWTESTARSCIEDAKEVGGHGDTPDIEQVAEGTYKLVS